MGWLQLAGVGARWRDALAQISRFLTGVGVRWRELVPRGHSFGHSGSDKRPVGTRCFNSSNQSRAPLTRAPGRQGSTAVLHFCVAVRADPMGELCVGVLHYVGFDLRPVAVVHAYLPAPRADRKKTGQGFYLVQRLPQFTNDPLVPLDRNRCRGELLSEHVQTFNNRIQLVGPTRLLSPCQPDTKKSHFSQDASRVDTTRYG